MKHAAVFVLLFSLGLFACSRAPATPSISDIQTAIAQTQTSAPVIPTIEPTNNPVLESPTQTPAPVTRAMPTPSQEPTNIASIIADTGAHFSYAQISGVAHLENGYFLITLEVPGGFRGDYYATIGEEQFDCLVLSEYPDRLYCTGLTAQAGTFATLQIFEIGGDDPIFEEEFGIPPLPSTDSIQARIKRDERDSGENPPADSVPYPYPYP